MLTTGGPALAAHASFDPDYLRAQGWISSHAVGASLVSPVVLAGLLGTLVEAAFPQAVPYTQSLQHARPLIVGVKVRAEIEVVDVTPLSRHPSLDGEDDDGDNDDSHTTGDASNSNSNSNSSKNATYRTRHGYQVDLKTTVVRDRDQVVIAQGTVSLWLPDYLRM
jgi:hypothetical protein